MQFRSIGVGAFVGTRIVLSPVLRAQEPVRYCGDVVRIRECKGMCLPFVILNSPSHCANSCCVHVSSDPSYWGPVLTRRCYEVIQVIRE